MLKPLSLIERASPEAVLVNLRSDSKQTSLDAAATLIAQASEYGLGLRDYLRLRIDPRLSENVSQFQVGANDNDLLTGYEAALAYLTLPTRDDLDGGITLQLAADTFQTFPGVRAFFPEVVDDMVKWNYRQTNFERLAGFISQTRTVSGNEVLSTVITDTQADYEEAARAIAEGGRIAIHTIKGSQSAVKFYKFGGGYKTSYEFSRRVSLDYLTPYAIRTQIETERSKVAVATYVLLNGDGVHGAAPVTNQSTYNTTVGTNATNGSISWKHLTAWLAARAQAGAPIDTVSGNWNAYLQWLWLFELKGQGTRSDAEHLAAAGFKVGGVPTLHGMINFELSTTVPDGQLLGFGKGFTLEELQEGGSLIAESERSIQTQEVTYVKTENSGFRLPFGDTRSVYNYAG